MIGAAGALLAALTAVATPVAFDPDASTLVVRSGAPLAGVHEEDWIFRLPDLLPSVRACLQAAGEEFAYAIVALPMNHGRMLTRVVTAGERRDCVAEGARVEEWREVRAGERLPAEDRTAFFLERGCVDAKRVENVEGRVVGWLGYPECRP